jgi:ferritin
MQMKPSEAMLQALNKQANSEFESAYIYLSMSYDMAKLGLKGFSHWLQRQYEEERVHAFKILSYVEEQDGTIELFTIPAYEQKFTCPLKAAQAVLGHEEKVTAQMYDLFGQARKENDYATELFLQWFVTEQIEEEVNGRNLVEKFTKANSDQSAMLQIDGSLGARP